MGDTVRFSAVSDMLERISKSKKLLLKRKAFRTFLDHSYGSQRSDYFAVMRLLLPDLDRERGNYGLKESVLAKCLADALGLAKGSPDADKLLNWRKGGAAAVGKNAGNFALVAAEIVGNRQSYTSGGLTVARVNELLDRLAEAKGREDKSKVLGELIGKTNPVEMKWLVMIILKDLKLGMSEKTMFKEFHPDADEVYNKTCDLKLVCEKLVDPKVRYKRQDIEVGKAVRPQLASRVKDTEDAWKKMRGKRVIAECKFDGDRCQVHKDGTEIHFFSRSSIDHVEFAAAMSRVICDSVRAEKCILDGEMVVWNRVANKFEPFGTIHTVAKNAKDGIETDEQLCYVIFDILYLDDCSVIHQPLCERQKLLQQRVRTVTGRIELLQPDRRNCGGQLWTITIQSAADLEKFFQVTVENRDEGIVVKDFDSKWEPGDRGGKWLKLKPDYVNLEDLDVLIIGGYYGSGRRGGEVAQFLLGIAERPRSGYPTKFHSFCKVGTGLSDEESQHLVDKLRPYFRRYDKNTKPPSYYVVTDHAKERPDVWIDQPDKSVILEVKSDVRKIKSEVFKSPYSLRFPRVHRVRYDKPWNECMDIEELVKLVEENNSAAENGNGNGGGGGRKKKERPSKKKQEKVPLLPADMQHTDVSGVKKVSDMLAGLVFFLVNFKLEDKERFHKLVTEYGGKFSMNLNNDVTHVLAESPRGLIYDAATKRGDVIHSSWLVDSIASKEILPLRPRYMLHLSHRTRESLKDTLDEFGDHYFVDVDEADMKQLFSRMRVEEVEVDEAEVDEHRDRIDDGRNIFGGYSFYFCYPDDGLGDDATIAGIVLRRLEVEVELHKGVVNLSLAGATHMIVFCDPEEAGVCVPEEKKLVSSKKVSVLSHSWLEEALRTGITPPETDYDVKEALGTRLVEEFPEQSPAPEVSGDEAEERTSDTEQEQIVEMELDNYKPEEVSVEEKPETVLANTLSLPTSSMDLDERSFPATHQLDTNPTVPVSDTLKLPTLVPETVKLPTLEPRTLPVETVQLPSAETVILPPVAAQPLKLPSFEADKTFDNLLADFGFFSSIPKDVPRKAARSNNAARPEYQAEVAAKAEDQTGTSNVSKVAAKREDRTSTLNVAARREDEAPPQKKKKSSLKDRVANFM